MLKHTAPLSYALVAIFTASTVVRADGIEVYAFEYGCGDGQTGSYYMDSSQFGECNYWNPQNAWYLGNGQIWDQGDYTVKCGFFRDASCTQGITAYIGQPTNPYGCSESYGEGAPFIQCEWY